MANNIAVTPGAGATFKTTDNAGVHTGHVNVDNLAADPPTQTTSAAILAKLSADPATQTTLAAILAKIVAAAATEAKQDTGNTSLASILAKIIAAPATEAKQDTILAEEQTQTGHLSGISGFTGSSATALDAHTTNLLNIDTNIAAILADANPAPVTLTAGGTAHDAAAASVNPALIGGYASAAAPTPVSADGDAVNSWLDRRGATMVNLVAAGALIPGDATLGMTVNSGGGVAHDGADSGNPVKMGGRARSSEVAAVANNDRSDFITDLVGKLITLPYANPENFVSGVTAAMTGTTTTSLLAAPAAGLRNYVTTIVVSNAHATVSTDVIIQDGSGGTTLMTIPAAAIYGGAVITLPVPLRQPTTATAIFCANVTTGASTKVSAVGYKGA